MAFRTAPCHMHAAMRCLALAFLAAALPAVAQAQTPAEYRAQANKLLDALKQAPTEAIAGSLEQQIRELWGHAGSPAGMRRMSRGVRELHAGAMPDAIEDFGDAIVLDPSMAEAYRDRAIARYQAGGV